jgi:hypothetical protein
VDDELKMTISICVTLVVLTAAIASCNVVNNTDDNKTMSAMVEKGESPVAARCAVSGNEGVACAIYAAKYESKIKEVAK